ncbi:TLDc [Musa troglodytarum]|uniref:TLDc n=1 Tax=Musa troglodytarum TaxID=320322 RepID=A0A9E7ECA7_9LILI|nr:TLDc [Musa troglodytarum]
MRVGNTLLDVQVLASESTPVPEHFPALSSNLGATLVSLFFPVADDRADGRIDWIGFLSGYNRCCGRMPVSRSINVLYRLYAALSREAGAPCGLEFDPDAGDGDKVSGSLLPGELLMLFWICWVMGHSSRIAKMSRNAKDPLVLPDMSHLLVSALVSCGVIAAEDEHIWRSDVLAVDKGVSAQKFQTWVLTTAPGLANCIPKYVQERIQACSSLKESEGSSISASDDNSAGNVRDVFLLTRGRAWAISLTLRDRLSEEFLAASFQEINSGVLYRLVMVVIAVCGYNVHILYVYLSSIHGKGLSRFWSNVEGYNGPLIVLVSASSAESSEVDRSSGGWVIGVLTAQGFENRETFFGSSGYLFAISPIFHVFPPTGKEKNFMYCHLHPAIRVYEANPKPVGLAFGGSTGNERIFWMKILLKLRCVIMHLTKLTNMDLSLLTSSFAGFLPVEAPVVEVEVWGFGGKTTKEQQDFYKKREMLFSEQRRKVDLKTFGSWEDSPEKVMMDMVSNPNKVRQEDR